MEKRKKNEVIMPRSVVQTMQSLHGKKEHGDSTVALDMKIVRDGNGGVEGGGD
jgi:hypothetical protein